MEARPVPFELIARGHRDRAGAVATAIVEVVDGGVVAPGRSKGFVCFSGPGFSPNMRAYLLSTGKAVELADLEVWLRFYFGLELRK
jgi:hypothetical protein